MQVRLDSNSFIPIERGTSTIAVMFVYDKACDAPGAVIDNSSAEEAAAASMRHCGCCRRCRSWGAGDAALPGDSGAEGGLSVGGSEEEEEEEEEGAEEESMAEATNTKATTGLPWVRQQAEEGQ